MEKQFLYKHKTDVNIIRFISARTSGFSRTILYPYHPDIINELQDKNQVLEAGEIPIYDMMGTSEEEQLVYTLITTRYITSCIDTTTMKCRIENLVLVKTFREVLDEFLNGTEHKKCLINYAKTTDGEDFIFFTESGTYQIMVYQIFKDIGFMCKKYGLKQFDQKDCNLKV